jgi:exonuclease SbcC
MIPHKLQLKNFLSYGSTLQTIDFGTYHLICLSGKNGHGKSALLDAMTWAVWGQARKTNTSVKADQGLLRLGQTQMMVIFDFECNGQRYRIRREYMQTHGKSYAVLEFGIIDHATDKLIPLTDKTIKATQNTIENTLRLDFDSFVNSAFLRQGNANEFSKKSSKDRKEILATILGLNRYDLIRKIALQKIKDAQTKEQTINAFVQKIALDLQHKQSIQEKLTRLSEHNNSIISEEQRLLCAKEEIMRLKQKIALAQQKVSIYTAQYNEMRTEAKKELENVKSLLKIWRTTRQKSKQLLDSALIKK